MKRALAKGILIRHPGRAGSRDFISAQRVLPDIPRSAGKYSEQALHTHVTQSGMRCRRSEWVWLPWLGLLDL